MEGELQFFLKKISMCTYDFEVLISPLMVNRIRMWSKDDVMSTYRQ